MGIAKGEAKEKGAEKIFKEIMAGKSPNLLKNINLPIQKASNRINAKRFTNRYITVNY